jgi:8-oxo-dGTP pyrophosphatase MutT (NUDIX family)
MASPTRARKLVVAALIRRPGLVLVSRRRADQPMPLLWEFPGGKVEPGEDPVVARARAGEGGHSWVWWAAGRATR